MILLATQTLGHQHPNHSVCTVPSVHLQMHDPNGFKCGRMKLKMEVARQVRVRVDRFRVNSQFKKSSLSLSLSCFDFHRFICIAIAFDSHIFCVSIKSFDNCYTPFSYLIPLPSYIISFEYF